MAPPLAPSPPRPFVDSPRISVDDEENAGLLTSYHSQHGEDYPPPSAPSSPTLPFSKARRVGTARRQFIALATFIFLACFLVASTVNYYYTTTPRSNKGRGIRQAMHERPLVELDEAKTSTQTPNLRQGHSVTAIVLHGLGQPNHEPPFVRKLARQFPYVKWVSPTADQLNVTVRGYEPTSAWFNIETFDDLSVGENVDEFVHSQQQLNRLVDREREAMVERGTEPRIVLAGFSQGAVMTILGLLTADKPDRFEGGIALSGYVPLLNHIDDLVSPASRDIPLFWGHGKQDPYLTIEQARSGSKLLRSARVGLRNLIFKEYEGLDHIWNEEELDDVVN
ncbi:hypothetical protein JCM3766R1_003195, partial [Sporobolomyces carnicolor]